MQVPRSVNLIYTAMISVGVLMYVIGDLLAIEHVRAMGIITTALFLVVAGIVGYAIARETEGHDA
ncbi:MAG: hypothetical protein GC159_03705 [Phycisphaera sp.]|nr:hypothetical protein [Phycisphaera sp.]